MIIFSALLIAYYSCKISLKILFAHSGKEDFRKRKYGRILHRNEKDAINFAEKMVGFALTVVVWFDFMREGYIVNGQILSFIQKKFFNISRGSDWDN